MNVLTIFRKKEGQKHRKAMSTIGVILLGFGVVGGMTFGYLTMQNGSAGLNTSSGVADVIGLFVSLASAVAGIYMM